MSETQAIAYAALWGSCNTAGDPGACMYGFDPEIGLKVQSEQHRENCLAHIENCKAKVDPENNVAHDETDPEQLECLAEMIRNAPVH